MLYKIRLSLGAQLTEADSLKQMCLWSDVDVNRALAIRMRVEASLSPKKEMKWGFFVYKTPKSTIAMLCSNNQQ